MYVEIPICANQRLYGWRAMRPTHGTDAETTDDVLTVRTEYLDAHTIHIVMSRNPQAFIYIFEFSTVSTSPDDWMFAGVSITPEITFTTPDPCRDYQFRVLVVLRSTNPQHQIAVLRPRAIQVTLPEFAVETDQITVEHPVYNSAEGTVTIYVKWKNPRGYADADIYGYEGAAVYPIQCLSPEDELPTPTVEQVTGGGRLKVSLPAEMLEGKCRLWVEVRMLPRCVRLEPFSVQQSLELDCERLADLDICKHEVSPQCTDVIDVWGSNGNVTVMWAPPAEFGDPLYYHIRYGAAEMQCTDVIDVWGSNGNVTVMWAPPAEFGDPLYYHIRYGAAEMQGVPPFVSWTIASRREVKAAGDAKSLSMQLDEDTDYGIQICAVYNEQRKKPKFGVVGVTPFICTSCKTIRM
uniref:Fibronectin type-III domain-containing protein n=1 Tax=Ascaris lumbricoides TaxID=6252 RepID=A0A0M3INA8_ASCLU